ncbi:MAG: hypothetical protein ACLQM8_12245 [Limisphaerales bacterium]
MRPCFLLSAACLVVVAILVAVGERVSAEPAAPAATPAAQQQNVFPESTVTQVPVKGAVLPVSEQLTWGQEPLEASTSKRGEVCLNGLWQFVPMLEPAETAPPGGLAGAPFYLWCQNQLPEL